MEIIERLEELALSQPCALVPTMGALHDGHASLIRRAAATGTPTVVSIFVNPTQFGPSEDFARYPRTLEADIGLATAAGARAIFLPALETMYPDGMDSALAASRSIALPPIATEPQLEDAWRPGHFGGVCQVVARLFDLCKPSQAFFGEKDYQQLRVITQMVELDQRRWPDLKIIPCETVREGDGIAMSSRNRYLSVDARTAALGISRALNEGARCHALGRTIAQCEDAMRSVLDDHGLEVQYAVIRNAETLRAALPTEHSRRALVAAKVGSVRLIDTIGISDSARDR
ncbi:MAG: pantoate--beta-alanine ligase [Phycisphaerales bacterium]|nr:pantoate--beta-alanine ligase [Phycisphaerales bacterium]